MTPHSAMAWSLSTPVSNAPLSLPGVSSFVASAGFPTSAFSAYYYSPAKPTRQPQPMIYDPVLNITFPHNLTNPDTIPDDKSDPIYFPGPVKNLSYTQKHALIDEIKVNVPQILQSDATKDSCAKCKKALAAAKPAALYAPTWVPDAMISLCQEYQLKSNDSCEDEFAASIFGATWTQVLAYADVEGLDGDYICNFFNPSSCAKPKTSPLDTTTLFPKSKPANASVPKPSGERVKVLHLSDIHLDPRYSVSSEANCSAGMCCRKNEYNAQFDDQIVLPASAYGAYKCDTPYDLALAALESVGPLTGTANGSPLAWTLYTGDLVSHEPENQLSQKYVEYTETSIFDMLKKYLGGPVFPVLGNHDTAPSNIDSPHSLPGRLGEQQSWNFEHVTGLWKHEGWIDAKTADEARTQYGGYSVKTHYGLRIIAFNSDFWYKSNYLNFINTTNPDNSGTFSWMITELQHAEDNHERVWIIGHVPSGWDGSNAFPNPTNLFYQIIDRYSPHVIANVFFGHNHEDEFMVYYADNGTIQNSNTALTTGWIGPSITPLTNLNSAFRLYEVDTGDFNIYNAYTFFSNVSEYSSLHETGPIFRLEYSTRETYGPAANWDANAPLNATFWHRVTEGMEKDLSLVSWFNALQGKRSIKSPACDSEECQLAKICYMRSGSSALGRECVQGYGSVQSDFKV
ncbi:PPN1 endopolyphosphatase family protein [Aspergillus chevalieri]|uniref:Sphingomyelin phosphodiesterase n=1 Tax=Aspergillus chevalieri TaxID=182096 RepID=A0A7R7ZNS5_ASPCH|nr:uncharacterized protein ACHE_40543S [Aspergillus chevalieri]BCR87979.1 hypothetical protein ACHE_40543S [Aspergillus chevalieri]